MKSVVGHSLRLIVLLVPAAAGTFMLLSLSPVDPIRAYIGNDLLHVPPEQYAHIAAHWGLDQPLWERFGHWFVRVLQGDLGYSMSLNAPVASVIKEHFSTSLALLGGAWLFSSILGTATGFVAGRYLNRWPDKAICRLSYLFLSLPTFWVGMLLLALFVVRWPVFPVCYAWDPGNSGDMTTLTGCLCHLVLPVCALSLLGLGQTALHMRESIASVMKSEFVRLARPWGDKGWPLLRYQVLRHTTMPAPCLQLASLGGLLGGALLAEKAFAYPGLGRAIIDVGLRGDLPLPTGIVLFSIVLVFIGSLSSIWLVRMLNRALERPDVL